MRVVNTSTKKYFKNFDHLISDMKKYISRNNNARIVQSDKPRQLVVGYKDENSGREWNITILSLRKWVSALDEQSRYQVQRIFLTKENRENLIKSLKKLI